MSISALTSRLPDATPTAADGRAVRHREATRAEGVPAIAPASSRGSIATPGLNAQAPAGTDPKLWSVLTSDERAFFMKAEPTGPLTYGRIMSPTIDGQPAPALHARRGARVDLRV
ncbi:MAG: hypothetical protein HYX65_03635 [Gemmatimonadetes bacterium]|nr:hypothetical protein [Gemmatimonadota bacterium]